MTSTYVLPTLSQVSDHLDHVVTGEHVTCPWCNVTADHWHCTVSGSCERSGAPLAAGEVCPVHPTVPRECTAGEARTWTDDYGEGYRVGRGDARFNASPRVPVVNVPDSLPHETGAQYVARYASQAWAFGYSRGYRYETAR